MPVWQIVKLGLYHSRDVIAANADVPPFAAAFGQTLGPIGSEVPFIIEQDVPKTGTAPIPLPGREWTTASLTRQRCSPAVVVAQPGLVGVLVGPRITHLEIGNALLFLPLPSIDPSIHATILRNVQVRTMAAATMSIQYE